jgi:cell pole-organizing protein PopZ
MGDVQPDPSMEEILASIKRVIREDGRAAAVAPPRRGRRVDSPPSNDEDVLELDEPIGEPASLLVSDDAAAASRHSLAALSAVRPPSATDAGALELVVRDMLRPILKEWLDENLPTIVEELVTREIARITGRKL